MYMYVFQVYYVYTYITNAYIDLFQEKMIKALKINALEITLL